MWHDDLWHDDLWVQDFWVGDDGGDDVDPFPGEALGIGSRRLNRRRYGGLWCALLILLAGCANGMPYEPCPSVVVYMSVDHGELGTDSVDYTPEC